MNGTLEIVRLRGAATHAENWARYVEGYRQELSHRTPEQLAAATAAVRARVESFIANGIAVGNLLEMAWRLTFSNLFAVGEVVLTPGELKEIRQEVRRLFLSHRDGMDMTRSVGELYQAVTGQSLALMHQLLSLIEQARVLEECVFRDWPSFAEPAAEAEGRDLPVDEALAEALQIDVEEARRRLERRRKQHDAANG